MLLTCHWQSYLYEYITVEALLQCCSWPFCSSLLWMLQNLQQVSPGNAAWRDWRLEQLLVLSVTSAIDVQWHSRPSSVVRICTKFLPHDASAGNVTVSRLSVCPPVMFRYIMITYIGILRK